MSTTNTSNLGLVLAVPGSKEPFNLVSHNANLSAIDAAIGLPVTKATTTTLSNSVTETQMMGGTLPANLPVGSTWRLVAFGSYDNNSVAATLTIRGKIGGTAFASNAISTPASLLTLRWWKFTLDLVVTSTPSVTGTVRGAMEGTYYLNTTMTPFVNTSAVATTVDTTGTPTLEVTAQWSVANAANTIRCDGGYLHRISNA